MRNKKLLVMIDDDSDDHEIFDIAINEIDEPFEIYHFDDCEQAIQHFGAPEAERPEFVFVDINLTRVGGLECISQLQNLRRFDDSRIIIYSSSIPETWKEKFTRNGIDEFLEKTGSLSDLKEKLIALLLKT